MSRYLMNAAVIPHGCIGTFTYRLATVEELIAFVQAPEVISTIVYPETHAWVKQVTGRQFAVPREGTPPQTLVPGDEAFVIRRTTRRAQDWKRPFDPAAMELGLLRYVPTTPAVDPAQVRGPQRHRARQARARRKS
jgi:hypothetical protein